MDRQEMLYKLEEYTNLETFFRTCAAIDKKIPIACFNSNINIDYSLWKTGDNPQLSHQFIWNTDNISLAYLENKSKPYPYEITRGGENGISLVKSPRFLDVIDLCVEFVSICYVFSGRQKLIIEGDELMLEPGNVVILAPFAKNSSIFIDENNITIQMYVRKDTFLRYFHNVLIGCGELSDFLSEAILLNRGKKYLFIKSQIDERFRDFVLDMIIEQERKRCYSDKILVSSIDLFLCQLIADYEKFIFPNKRSEKTNLTVAAILYCMRENITTISTEELSHRFSFSPSYITRLLKQHTDKNYIQLLTEMKLDRAKALLSEKNLSVEDISVITGYNCSRQFRRAFKDAFGISPREFRIESHSVPRDSRT